MHKVTVSRFPITAAQFLKWAGAVLTGGEAKDLIREGYVLINGQVVTAPGHQLAAGDTVEILGEETIAYQVAGE